jgi:hypothetical protein
MKGVVFTEFLGMVDETFGPATTASLVGGEGSAARAAYTPVGSYAAAEMLALVERLVELSGAPRGLLLHAYGKQLFGRFAQSFPQYFEGAGDCFAFLAALEQRLPQAVRELYPDAPAPSYEYRRNEDDERVELTFGCAAPLEDFAGGLLEGAIDHYGAPIEVTRRELADGRALFELRKLA